MLGFRLEIGSYCSLIERELKKQVESYLNKWSRFQNHKISLIKRTSLRNMWKASLTGLRLLNWLKSWRQNYKRRLEKKL